MKQLGWLILLVWCLPASAKDCGEAGARHWSTVLKLAAGPVTLHWTSVYEARQAVCSLSYRNTQGQTETLEVWGEPEPNAAESLIAFASCPDDGCDRTIMVADLARGVLIKGDLPVSAQPMYFSFKWRGAERVLSIEIEGVNGRPPREFTCAVTDRVVCAPSES